MIPHARLQPSAPTSIARTSSRPAWATLNEQVKVRTMIKAKRISEILSIGSRRRSDELVKLVNMGGQKFLLLPPSTQCTIDFHQCQALFELGLSQPDLGVEVSSVAIENFQKAGD